MTAEEKRRRCTEYMRGWRKRNPDKIKANEKRCYEKRLATNRKAYNASCAVRARKYRERNPDRIREIRAKYREANLEAINEYQKERFLKTRYGITVAQRDALIQEQEGKCAICGEAKQLVTDHCHKSRVVRGMLCRTCNLMLGYAYDNPDILEKAIAYLESNENVTTQ